MFLLVLFTLVTAYVLMSSNALEAVTVEEEVELPNQVTSLIIEKRAEHNHYKLDYLYVPAQKTEEPVSEIVAIVRIQEEIRKFNGYDKESLTSLY